MTETQGHLTWPDALAFCAAAFAIVGIAWAMAWGSRR